MVNDRHVLGCVAQRHGLYLGEINSSQLLAWRRTIEVIDETTDQMCPPTDPQGVFQSPGRALVRSVQHPLR